MVVSSELNNEEGQSLLEFLLMLPLMLGLTTILLRVNTAIQVSINNQRHTAGQARLLLNNSSVYPYLELREAQFVRIGTNQMVLGVSAVSTLSGSGATTPEAMTVRVTRRPNGGGSDSAQDEPDDRSKVRVRNTLTICTQDNVLATGGGNEPILPLGPKPQFFATGINRLTENSKFDFCRGIL